MTLRVRAAAETDVGLARDQNEDALVVRPPLFAVADGVGGRRAGERASMLALEILDQQLSRNGAVGRSELAEAVRAANAAVWATAADNATLAGMATTCTAMVIDTAGHSGLVGHVGDSRAYRLRSGLLALLTADHTVAAALVREGRARVDEANELPGGRMLSRAIGSRPEVEVDVSTVELAGGDRLLLCTDGLSSMLEDGELGSVLAEGSTPEDCATLLVAAAIEAGGLDNVTVIVIDVDAIEAPP